MKSLITGFQPTGSIHIGNYFGAIKNLLELQDSGHYDSHCFIADLHAQSLVYDHKNFSQTILNTARLLLSCGIDPNKTTLFIQSHVVGHTELAWALSTVAPYGDLERMTQFKDKSQKSEESRNVALFSYPLLMSADILLYQADVVPVGEDQEQHLELTRTLARKFNQRYQKVFKEPQSKKTPTKKVIGLDGVKKMSKSLGNTILLIEEEEEILKRLMKVKTDEQRVKLSDKGDTRNCPVIYLYHQILGDMEGFRSILNLKEGCETGTMGCVECKKILASKMAYYFESIRERYEGLREKQVEEILRDGHKRAQQKAEEMMENVYEAMGMFR